jgi:hypothetical protein
LKGVFSLFFGIKDATAGRIPPAQSRIDHRGSTPHTCLHANRLDRAVGRAGSAFHACVTGGNPDLTVVLAQYRMGADQEAHAAADAFLLVERERHNVFEINERTHDQDSSSQKEG